MVRDERRIRQAAPHSESANVQEEPSMIAKSLVGITEADICNLDQRWRDGSQSLDFYKDLPDRLASNAALHETYAQKGLRVQRVTLKLACEFSS
jgi:hypothetical protein